MRTLPYAFVAALVAGAGATWLHADEPPTPAPAAAPEAKASEGDVLKWIADLASDDFRTREAASKKLADAGEAARAALETAAKTSDSLEVRWRAEQLLLRLDESGARPLGKPGDPVAPRSGAGRDRAAADAWLRSMERWLREMRRRDGPGGFGLLGGQDPFATFGSRLTSGDLTLTVPLFGGPVRLTVRGKDGTSTTHTGRDLDEILAAHPELKDAPGMADLQKQAAERTPRSRLFEGFTGPHAGATIQTFVDGVGVEATQDANGAVVRITEPGEDGKPKTTEYRGASLDEIKEKNPQVAKHLKGIGTFKIEIGPRIFDGRRDGGLAPLVPPAAPPVPAPAKPDGVAFGLLLGPVEPVLALHLGLENGRGVVVEHVDPGSQAEALGIQRYDVIESIDGAPVLDFEQARQVLRAAAKAKAPLSLGIVRTGKKQTLSR